MARLSDDAPSLQVSLARALVRGLVAGLALALGTLLIYGLGAGYFVALAVPTPINFVVAPVMFVGLILPAELLGSVRAHERSGGASA